MVETLVPLLACAERAFLDASSAGTLWRIQLELQTGATSKVDSNKLEFVMASLLF